MTITLGINSSENNKLDKSVATVATLEGTLREKTSVSDPVIVVELPSFDTIPNYMSIPAFNRKYFITDIVAVNNKLFEIHAHVDVLSSFKSQIRTNKAIVLRQENKNNLYLADANFHVYQNPTITTQTFPNGFDPSNASYILAMAGR